MNMIFRPATMEDARQLFDWRNDPQTRVNSINIKKVEWESHVTWLESSLVNSSRRIFIAMIEGEAVGTIRLDDDSSKGKTELSWTIAPDQRGKGYGQAMVQAAIDLPLVKGKKILARIKPENTPSIKIVEKLGFVKLAIEPPEPTEWLIQR